MADEDGLEEFVDYYTLGDELVAQATKAEVAEAARLLAMHVAYYHERFGPVSDEEILRSMTVEALADEDKARLQIAMAILARTLKMILS